MKKIKVQCQVCKEQFVLKNSNYFVMGIQHWQSLYVHKACKEKLAIIDGKWEIINEST